MRIKALVHEYLPEDEEIVDEVFKGNVNEKDLKKIEKDSLKYRDIFKISNRQSQKLKRELKILNEFLNCPEVDIQGLIKLHKSYFEDLIGTIYLKEQVKLIRDWNNCKTESKRKVIDLMRKRRDLIEGSRML